MTEVGCGWNKAKRAALKRYISRGMTYKAIAARLGVSPASIGREVKARGWGAVELREAAPQRADADFVAVLLEGGGHSRIDFVRRVLVSPDGFDPDTGRMLFKERKIA